MKALWRRLAATVVVLALVGLVVADEWMGAFRNWWDRHSLTGSIVSSLLVVAFRAVMDDVGDELSTGATEEMRTLASMLLTASPNLFDDPIARRFLTQLQRVTGSMFRLVLVPAGQARRPADRDRLSADMAELRSAVEPLLTRISIQDQSTLEGPLPD